MSTKEFIYEHWRSTVSRVKREACRQFPEVPAKDIEQECWRWVFATGKRGPAYAGFKYLLSHARKFAWKEAQAMDPSKRPKRLYTDKEMEVFLKVVLQPKLREKAQPNWEAWLDEISAALKQLDQYDQNVLTLRYWQRFSLRQIGEEIGKSTSQADRDVWSAIARLQDILEGEPPAEGEWSDTYVGTGGTISNATARHIIGRNE